MRHQTRTLLITADTTVYNNNDKRCVETVEACRTRATQSFSLKNMEGKTISLSCNVNYDINFKLLNVIHLQSDIISVALGDDWKAEKIRNEEHTREEGGGKAKKDGDGKRHLPT